MKKALFAFLFFTQISCAQQDLTQATKLKEEAANALETENYQETFEKAGKALDLFKKKKDTLSTMEALYLLARASALTEDFEKAVEFGEEASRLCLLKENFPLEHKINNTLSWAYWALGSDFYENLDHQKRQLFVVDQLDDERAKAQTYNNYGYDTTVSGTIPLDTAITYSIFANDFYAKAEGNTGRWYTLMNLTWQYRLKNDLEKSEYYGELSAQQAKTDKDRHAIIEANANLGETLLYQNRLQEATPYYEEALKWSSQREDRDKYVFDVYYSKYLWQKGEKQKAVSIVKNAIKFLETSEVFYEMLGRAFLAAFSFELNNLEEVRKQLKVFVNPRSNYISLEARTIAKIVKARLLSKENREQAMDALEKLATKLKEVGAKQLLMEVQKAKKEIG